MPVMTWPKDPPKDPWAHKMTYQYLLKVKKFQEIMGSAETVSRSLSYTKFLLKAEVIV